MQVEPEVLLAAKFSARTDLKPHKFYCYILWTTSFLRQCTLYYRYLSNPFAQAPGSMFFQLSWFSSCLHVGGWNRGLSLGITGWILELIPLVEAMPRRVFSCSSWYWDWAWPWNTSALAAAASLKNTAQKYSSPKIPSRRQSKVSLNLRIGCVQCNI